MSPGARRGLTAQRYSRSLRELGVDHPKTQAAAGRMVAAWGFSRVSDDVLALKPAGAIAMFRECGHAGHSNRHTRKRARRVAS